MLHRPKKRLLIIVSIIFLIMMFPITALANSAQSPSLIIIVNYPPSDLTITLLSDEMQPEAEVRKVAWEGYYVYYGLGMQENDQFTFLVNTGTDCFECTINDPINYESVFTLDLETHTITLGKYPLRSFILIVLRLLLTLLIEGIVFWLFWYREKRSWVIFLVVNLITQGLLNIWLIYGTTPFESYLIFRLIFGEFLVFVIELGVFPAMIKEKKSYISLLYAFLANMISLILGVYLMGALPI